MHMKTRDWVVNGDGNYELCKSVRSWDLLKENYRLYRFLTEVEDALYGVEEEHSQLPTIRKLVRKLILNSYWVKSQRFDPNPKNGIAVSVLYEELGFPFTVQTVKFFPGAVSTVHTHGTWGVVAVLKGQEKNTFWQRNPTNDGQVNVQRTGELVLFPGDIISFTPDAIHSIEALGDEPTITFNIYGETKMQERFEFDRNSHTVKNF